MQMLLPLEWIAIQPIEVSNKLGNKHKAEPHAESNAEDLGDLLTLPKQMKESNRTNVLFEKVWEYLANFTDRNRPNVYLCGSKAENGLLYKDNKL